MKVSRGARGDTVATTTTTAAPMAAADRVVDVDADVIARARTGDYAAFEALVKRHQSRVYGLALGITKNAAEAEEVAQDTFVSLFENLETFRGDARLSTWLFRVATNHALMKLRKKRPEAMGNATDLEPLMQGGVSPFDALSLWARNPDEALMSAEVHAAVVASLDALSAEDRALILVRAFDDASHDDLAHQFNTTVPAIKSRLHRARLALRQLLEANLRGHPPGAQAQEHR